MAANRCRAVALTQWACSSSIRGLPQTPPRSTRSADLRLRSRRRRQLDELVSAVGVLRTLLGDLGLTGFSRRPAAGIARGIADTRDARLGSSKRFTKAVADLMARTFSRPLSRGDVEISPQRQNFHRLLANASARPQSRPIRCAPGPTRRWPHLSAGTSSPRTSVSITSTCAPVPSRLSALKSDPWADFLELRQSISKAMFNESGRGLSPGSAAIGAFIIYIYIYIYIIYIIFIFILYLYLT